MTQAKQIVINGYVRYILLPTTLHSYVDFLQFRYSGKHWEKEDLV